MKTHLNNIKKQSKTERSKMWERDREYNHNFMQSPFQRFSSFILFLFFLYFILFQRIFFLLYFFRNLFKKTFIAPSLSLLTPSLIL